MNKYDLGQRPTELVDALMLTFISLKDEFVSSLGASSVIFSDWVGE